ncbi:PRD domain-containing protein [Clostridium sp. Sa3CUN1]|uniref:PRD domain-containing protein n=1 Tax=Clostridium gallinarum TaxID=2762246 RepID=A0ABR8Q4R2_9CLOT|nr:PRD domain-containing protein [Clostridium gallinarum]MBD7915401.1 PRD domain-containing protein [Clostridium gallinarum]
MKITRIINNNVICAINVRRQEVMLLGSGIGFQKKKGDEVDKEKIEKEFFLKSKNVAGKLYALLAQIPAEYMAVSDSIIKEAKETLGKDLNENIYITLTDHINFAVSRFLNGLNFKNALLWEVKKFYPSEFKIALKGLETINREFNVDLPEDEAASIALHIVNAELGSEMEEVMEMTQLIQKVLNLVRYNYKINFNEESLNYMRFITHLKFFSYRLFSNKIIETNDVEFQDIIRDKYKDEYECSLKIRDLVNHDYKKELTEEELVYLTVHIRRVVMEEKMKK